jgi:hypothetical protein
VAVEVEHGGGAMLLLLLLLRLQAGGRGEKGAEVGWHARRGSGGKPTSGHMGQGARRPSRPAIPGIRQPTNHLCSPAGLGAPRLVGGHAAKPRGAACHAAGVALRLCSAATRRGLL